MGGADKLEKLGPGGVFDSAGREVATVRYVRACGACGQDHPILFIRLDQPDEDGDTHLGLCMVRGVIVGMRDVTDGDRST